MADDFPTEYDGIVVGTGITESIIAAALSRIGYKVLHLDREDYYSSDAAAFHLQGIQEWLQKQQTGAKLQEPDDDKIKSLLADGEKSTPLQVKDETFSNVEEFIYVSEEPEPETETLPADPVEVNIDVTHVTSGTEGEDAQEGDGDTAAGGQDKQDAGKELSDNGCAAAKQQQLDAPTEKQEGTSGDTPEKETSKKQWSWKEIKDQWRKFNIELSPKVLYCDGDMVKLLISSDVAKYCEFKTITRVLTILDGKLTQVPCSRADVFDSKQVSMIEKRMMMKFLQFCIQYEQHQEQYQDFTDKPFSDFLKSQKLTAKIQHYIHHSIAMATDQTKTVEALKSCQKFLRSLGKYGNTAFLWPIYGSGELSQCFCRMCAVFGGIYHLQKCPAQLVLSGDNQYQGIIDTDGLKLKSKWLILNSSYASHSILPKGAEKRCFSRAVLITDRSLMQQGTQDHISLLHLPVSSANSDPVTLYELSYQSYSCPKDLYVVHLTTVGRKSPKEDLSKVISELFHTPAGDEDCPPEDKPHVLWCLYFNKADFCNLDLNEKAPEGVFILRGTGGELDCDNSVHEAKALFEKICPNEEFLPKAPNPEDIVFYDETGNPGTGGGEGLVDAKTNQDAENEARQQEQSTGEGQVESGSIAAGVTCEGEKVKGDDEPNMGGHIEASGECGDSGSATCATGDPAKIETSQTLPNTEKEDVDSSR